MGNSCLLYFLVFFLSIFFVWVNLCYFYMKFSYYSFIVGKGFSSLNSMLQLKSAFWVVYLLFYFMFIMNILGNIPMNGVPTLFYSQTISLSMVFWVPIMVCVCVSQLKEFLAHMLPYGSPVGLMLFLPLVEVFSQIIRPFTLMIRLSTNLSSGHIMLYMFSYFTLLSSALSPLIMLAIFVLYLLEICISMLQAYIFVTLLSLYVAETDNI